MLAFKKGITRDPDHLLSSWRGWDCCRWRGVTCRNITGGHVLKLHLANPDPDHWIWIGFEGEISPSLLSLEHLEYLDLSNNWLEGATSPMPAFLGSMKNLRYLNLSGIRFSGGVPPQFGNLSRLQYLDLGDTVISSTDIAFLTNLPMLQYLSLSQINLSWIADWPQKINMIPSLRLLWKKIGILRSGWNMEVLPLVRSVPYFQLGFSSSCQSVILTSQPQSIPHDIVYLSSLHFLDVSSNNLSGLIPQHLENLTGMTTRTPDNRRDTHGVRTIIYGPYGQDFIVGDQFDELLLVMTKGQQLKYGKGLDHFVSIDLSDNSLSGEIPSNITSLDALINLNLSSNNLWGKIPVKIGAIMALQSLDVSENKLSGEIPSSLSNLTSLSYMNLSYNNLSGRIPSGRQLDTLNADNPSIMYIGNSGLCGPPLQKMCSVNGSFIHGNGTSYGHETGPLSFYLGLLLGLVVGLWMVFCALLFKKAWRIAYFRLFDRCYDTIYVHVVLMWARLTRNAAAE
ncbi:hypothetical protein U9M48_004984 [Paspalum notatum var. saurae]|uniref:Leucine-rich repeat-containing N-terminal plant-type domain-containing protein n=1 Tax=Paspalum notatum var. saurae TaxID=547442 RepID=A0AAQ3PLD7_PASNO